MFKNWLQKIQQRRIQKRFKRLQDDWKFFEMYMVKTGASRTYRRQLRKDLIKGISKFFDAKDNL